MQETARRPGRPRNPEVQARHERIYQLIAQGIGSRSELAAATGLDRTTVAQSVHRLKLAGRVRKCGSDRTWVWVIADGTPAPERRMTVDIEKKILDAVSAEGTEWQTNAPCAAASFDFIPDVETEEGLTEAQQWCRTCDVSTKCLAWAMLHQAEGYWGGTSTYQRNQLRRVRTRAKCPLCLGTALVYADPHELCLSCGVSWIRDVREEPIAATPLPANAA